MRYGLSPRECAGFLNITYEGSQPLIREMEIDQTGLCSRLTALAKICRTRRIRFRFPVLIAFRQRVTEQIFYGCAPNLTGLRNRLLIDGMDRPQLVRRKYQDSGHDRDLNLSWLCFRQGRSREGCFRTCQALDKSVRLTARLDLTRSGVKQRHRAIRLLSSTCYPSPLRAFEESRGRLASQPCSRRQKDLPNPEIWLGSRETWTNIPPGFPGTERTPRR